jgi:hypothetical protein
VGDDVAEQLWQRVATAANESVRVIVTCGVPGKRGAAVRKQAIIEYMQSLVKGMYLAGLNQGYDMGVFVSKGGDK